MAVQQTTISNDTTIELVRSLFTTLLNTVVMAVSFTCVGILVLSGTHSIVLSILTFLGSGCALVRIGVVLRYRKRAGDPFLDIQAAQRLETYFAAAYCTFAVTFGLFCAVAFAVTPADTRTVIIGLLFGYGAGVAAGVSLRPWIGVSSILIATIPTILVAWSTTDLTRMAAGWLLAVFLAGGVRSIFARHQTTAADIAMRRSFSRLARHDHLTGLLNRLSLRERFDAFAQAAGGVDIIAVHCLDLDRFKPVNDRYGHPVGDALLKAVAVRIEAVLQESDFAARTGGDEFVIVQTQARHADEVDALAELLICAIAAPFPISEFNICIGTSIGYVLSSEYGTDIDNLVARADEALCAVKRAGGGIRRYDGTSDGSKCDPLISLAA
ncbi:GGDEF domain-containing protein (plasmid) [Polymorphobacter sp. PAMC 29334]|uniref:GGDEF domain-containing protein n=1 Tax=Polymorphobacter sp. PAMC 29334 TaxID=2862331 RepID=UPI001C6809E1|nr:GGDEF domain-containing protein [Polymorphobacter sp. PAMC 29334]QYE37165.1 GGDEF domain-containing protein [Polymorphobacter sp. PAMC 29334]